VTEFLQNSLTWNVPVIASDCQKTSIITIAAKHYVMIRETGAMMCYHIGSQAKTLEDHGHRKVSEDFSRRQPDSFCHDLER
jgi:hypothetical protein